MYHKKTKMPPAQVESQKEEGIILFSGEYRAQRGRLLSLAGEELPRAQLKFPLYLLGDSRAQWRATLGHNGWSNLKLSLATGRLNLKLSLPLSLSGDSGPLPLHSLATELLVNSLSLDSRPGKIRPEKKRQKGQGEINLSLRRQQSQRFR